MKKLSFEQMEEVNGGEQQMSYCDQLKFWVIYGTGYQGDYAWLVDTWIKNCVGQQ